MPSLLRRGKDSRCPVRPRVTSAADDPFERLLDHIAGHSAIAITLVNDPASSLSAVGHALIETAKDVPLLLAAVRKVLEVAGDFDAEDGHVPVTPGQVPVSRGGRVRQAVLAGLIGEDGIAALG